jgi:hypothetical protein
MAATFLFVQPVPRRIRGLFSEAVPRLDERSGTGRLGEEEMREIVALGEALLPQDRDAAAAGAFVRRHVNERTTRKNGYLEEYERAVLLLQETTYKVLDSAEQFSALPMADRNAVLAALLESRREGIQRARNLLDRVFGSGEVPAFKVYVAEDLLKAYYRSPEGWGVVGYSNYPGVPARDPREYTRPSSS